MQEEVPNEADVESDSLEAEANRKRRNVEAFIAQRPSYDPTVNINHFEAKGSYSLDLIGQQRVSRRTRSTEDHLQLPEVVESNLLAFINHSKHTRFTHIVQKIIMIVHVTR